MGQEWVNDIMELIRTIGECLKLVVRKRNMIAGVCIGAAAAGLGMAFGPVGLVAGRLHTFQQSRTVAMCFYIQVFYLQILTI